MMLKCKTNPFRIAQNALTMKKKSYQSICCHDENLLNGKIFERTEKKSDWRYPGWQYTYFFNIRSKILREKRTKQIINVKMSGFSSWMTNRNPHTNTKWGMHPLEKSSFNVSIFFFVSFVTKWMFDIDVIWFSGHGIHFRSTSSLHQTTNV